MLWKFLTTCREMDRIRLDVTFIRKLAVLAERGGHEGPQGSGP